MPSARTAELKPDAPGSHWVQVGLFKDASNADALARKVRQQGFPVQVARVKRDDAGLSGSGGSAGAYLLVRAGGFADRSAAISARAALSAKGYPGFLTEGSAK
jgi:cell division septation protein DedD